MFCIKSIEQAEKNTILTYRMQLPFKNTKTATKKYKDIQM
jgi:hypothetical protein